MTPTARWPPRLPAATVETVLAAPLPTGPAWKRHAPPKVSIVIVAFNNLVYNRICLESVLANTAGEDFEIVVVDNGSTDGTDEYLRKLRRRHAPVEVISTRCNLGFAPAVNRGLARARGELLVLLNNDTLVPPAWLPRLLRHLEDPAIGMVGPVTNRAGNEAQIAAGYHTYGQLERFAGEHAGAHDSRAFDIGTLTMFCAAMRRGVYERIGPLDEEFTIGMFEDDDYCLRVRAAGYRVVCAEDVFVHHFGQASLGLLARSGEYGKLFHANRRRFEVKWGVCWKPHAGRSDPTYQQLKEAIRQVVETALPRDATIAVVSKGDSDLLSLEGRRMWHFPQNDEGAYAGHYPPDSTEAIAHLEALRLRGAQFLLFPGTALWWLDHYEEFRRHLEGRYRMIPCPEQTCVIFAL
ncbi:MAG: glycosyltransferase family 2 protein [Acidobacteria bacterium]|nr:glycosyltransferase family 2 protein [Acidobacteriota bacterium]